MRPPPILVGVAGGSASGKSTLARELLRVYNYSAILGEDSYYYCSRKIPRFDPSKHNFDEPAAKDHPLLAEHLSALRRREAFDRPIYAFPTHTREGFERFEPIYDLIIVEGLHILAPDNVRRHFDITVYIDADIAVRRRRRVARDISERGRTPEFALAQFEATVQPMHLIHIEPQKPLAQLVLDSSDGDMPAMVAAVRQAISEVSSKRR